MKFKRTLGERCLGILGLVLLIAPFSILGLFISGVINTTGPVEPKQIIEFLIVYHCVILLVLGRDILTIIALIFEVEK